MEIQLINSEKFYITQQEIVFYERCSGKYNGISIESAYCPAFESDDEEYTLYLRGRAEHRDHDNLRVPRDMMTKVLTALSLCCIDKGVTLTIKL